MRSLIGLACLSSPQSSAAQSSYSIRTLRAVPCSQHQPRCCRRYTSDATASLNSESQRADEKPLSNNNNRAPGSTTTSKPSPASSISEHVRLLMRQVPYPVAIITATEPSGPADTTSFRGMTVSSFNTVTLTPHPVISFNVRRPSETLNALLASGRFLVHLLAPGPTTATLARDFSKGNVTLASMLSGHGDFEFGALDVSSSEGSERPLPILRRKQQDSTESNGDGDFPFIFECTLHPHKMDVHDHSIVLGTVVRAIQDSKTTSAVSDCTTVKPDENSSESLCLTYANARFWKTGQPI